MLTDEQTNACVALILVIAISGQDEVGLTQATCKRFLATLPVEDVAKAAGTPIDFNTYGATANA